MVIFFPLIMPEKEKNVMWKIISQSPFNIPQYNVEIVSEIHRSHFISQFPNMYWVRVHVYKKINGMWSKIIHSAHMFLRYKIKNNQYINPPPHPNNLYWPDLSKYPNGEWEYYSYTAHHSSKPNF